MSIKSKCPACRLLSSGSCDKCKAKKNRLQRRRREKLIAEGKCIVCKNPAITSRCDKCKNRQKNNLKETPCVDCGATRETKEFIISKNICKECSRERSKIIYKKSPKEKWTEKHKIYVEKNMYNWLRVILRACIINGSKKRLNNRSIQCAITIDNLMQLFEKQDGLCAITKIPLKHQLRNLTSASLDRIDSNGHYTIDNIQLVCKAVNLAKSIHTNQEIKEFIQLVKTQPNN